MTGVDMRTVAPRDAGLRLDRWFKSYFPEVRHGALEKLLRTGQVRVDGGRVKANHRLEAGQVIRIPPLDVSLRTPWENEEDAPTHVRPTPSKRTLRDDASRLAEWTILEDDALLVLNKPFGLAVQGGTRTERHVDGMLAALETDGDRPRLVHRLDRDTGGVLVLAKTREGAARLGGAFQRHEVEKTYWALCAATPSPKEGVIDLPIAKRMVRIGDGAQERVVPAEGEDARKAITEYETIESAGGGPAFVALRPLTGRTHQLRVHCAAIGAPIVGDRKYGGPASRIPGVADGLHLFCRSMSFPHPENGRRVTVVAPLTKPMLETWRLLSFDLDAADPWDPTSALHGRKRSAR